MYFIVLDTLLLILKTYLYYLNYWQLKHEIGKKKYLCNCSLPVEGIQEGQQAVGVASSWTTNKKGAPPPRAGPDGSPTGGCTIQKQGLDAVICGVELDTVIYGIDVFSLSCQQPRAVGPWSWTPWVMASRCNLDALSNGIHPLGSKLGLRYPDV